MKNHQQTRNPRRLTLTAELVLILPLAALLFAGQVRAATVILATNNFEGFTDVATSFADIADADPTGAEWVIGDDTARTPTTVGAGVQVINWLTNSAGGANKCLLLRPHTEALLMLPDARTGSSYQLDFWTYASRQATSDRNFFVTLRGEGSDSNGDDYFAYQVNRATNSTILRYYDGVGPSPSPANWVNTTANQTTDQWQHHRVVINAVAMTFTLYVDDMVNPVVSNGDLARGDIPAPTQFRIYNEANSNDDGWYAIDDILLTVDGSRDLTTVFREGFESYTARTGADDDADPGLPWIVSEIFGTGAGQIAAPGKVQVVGSDVVQPHSGTKCLKLENGQRSGLTYAWGTTPLSDVQVTWWARVPEAYQTWVTNDAVFLRFSLYGEEDGNTYAGDSALLGYGIRRQGNTNMGDATTLLYYKGSWQDTTYKYTPNVWEEYRLITHNAEGRYTIIQNPSSATPLILVDRQPMIGGTTSWGPSFMAAWSSSNGTNHPPVYIDDIEIKSIVSNPTPLGDPYTITNYGSRFTNWSILTVNGPVGKPAVDPRDNSTILFTLDTGVGGIYKADKIAPGNWRIDPVPLVTGLDRPSGLAIEPNGTIWWTHDYNNDFTRSVARLKWPWSNNVPETIIADAGSALPTTDDDAIDVTIAPASFTGSIGQPGMVVVADRGLDGDAFNAVYVIDPATTSLNQTNYVNFLAGPTSSDLGANLNAITSLPDSGEVATLSGDGYLVAINGSGGLRYINAVNLWPIGGTAAASALAFDPVSKKIFAADNLKDEIWSIDPASAADQREFGFLLTDPQRPDGQIAFHEPGMAFSPNGSCMIITDSSTANRTGGRLIIFHNETISVPSFSITLAKPVAQGFQLNWESAGAVTYRVQRGSTVTSLQDITVDLTTTTYTDTNNVGNAFYRVVARP